MAVALLAAIGAGFAVVTHRPALNGSAVVAVIMPAPLAPATPSPSPAAAPKTTLTSAEVEDGSGVTVVRPPGAGAGQGMFIEVPQDRAVALHPAPDPRLVEKTQFGLLPRRGAGGAQAFEVYARPLVVDSTLPAHAPKIAIMVGGMGLNTAATSAAAFQLPPAITFGFAPYGDDLERQVQAARDAGHEVILQVPMEGFGDPSSSSMSHLLLAERDGRDNLDRLHWLMGRFTGYVGVANFLGGKFTADSEAFDPVFRDIVGRGLLYFDDATAPRSVAGELATQTGAPFAHADVAIDAGNTAASIDAALKDLERRARDTGAAVGFANGVPAAIGPIAAFAQGLAGRGIALVPATALVVRKPPADTQAVSHP